MSIPSPEQPITRPRPAQIAESVVAALSDHVYRAARERALQDAIEQVLRGRGFQLGSVPSLDLTGIDLVLAGGESGPQSRLISPEWVRNICDRCTEANIASHFNLLCTSKAEHSGEQMCAA